MVARMTAMMHIRPKFRCTCYSGLIPMPPRPDVMLIRSSTSAIGIAILINVKPLMIRQDPRLFNRL